MEQNKRPRGRPRTRNGIYERRDVEIRTDLLAFAEDQPVSLRETVEEALILLKETKMPYVKDTLYSDQDGNLSLWDVYHLGQKVKTVLSSSGYNARKFVMDGLWIGTLLSLSARPSEQEEVQE